MVLDALMSDGYPDLEVVVADGASTDGTVELLQSYGDRVRWVSELDGGEFQARNKALRMATGEIIRNLSDDDVPVPGSIALGVRYLIEHPKVDILFGQSVNYYVRQSGEVIVNDTRPRTARSITIENFIYGKHLFVVSETVFMRRRVVESIGVFEAIRGGDYEYWARAAHRGMTLAISDDLFVHHYRFEAGELAMRNIYRDLLAAMGMLAHRYGTRWDKIWVPYVYLPYRLARYDLISRLPPSLALTLRRWLWTLRGAGGADVAVPAVRASN
jgi:glycosyltransferase involved in cell wall biosynthesis